MKLPVAAAAAAALFIWTTGGMLPARLASHFSVSGAADGFMSRPAYLTLMIAVVVIAPLACALAGQWLHRLPDHAINLPNKDYWLAPERRAESIAALSRQLQWTSIGLSVFLCLVHWQIVRGNMVEPPRLDLTVFLSLLAVFLAGLVWSLVALYRRFRRPG